MSTVIVVVDHLVVFGVTRIILVVVPMSLVDARRNLWVLVYGGSIGGSSGVLWMTHGHTPSSRNSGNTRGVARINVVVDGGAVRYSSRREKMSFSCVVATPCASSTALSLFSAAI